MPHWQALVQNWVMQALLDDASLLKRLVKKASTLSEGKMVMRPTKIDRSALADAAKGYKMGDDVDGLGGFMLEAEDGTLSFDLRFDTLLEDAWVEQRAAVNETYWMELQESIKWQSSVTQYSLRSST